VLSSIVGFNSKSTGDWAWPGIVEYLAWCCTFARGDKKNTTRGAGAAVEREQEHLPRLKCNTNGEALGLVLAERPGEVQKRRVSTRPGILRGHWLLLQTLGLCEADYLTPAFIVFYLPER